MPTKTAQTQPTERQQEALSLLEQGLSTDEIAKRMGVSDNGVYQHKRRLIQRGFLTPAAPPKAKVKPAAPRDNERFSKISSDVLAATEEIDAELSDIARREEGLGSELSQLQARKHELQGHRDALTSVRETLSAG